MTFFFHYNKPASQRAGKVHTSLSRQCQIVDNVVVKVLTTGKVRKTHPYFVMKGKCSQVSLVDNVITIE